VDKKNVYVILGFLRCGTSVITRSLQALNIDLGEKLVTNTGWNPTGYFEDNEIMHTIHAKLFSTLGHQTRSIRLFEKELLVNNPALDSIKNSAMQLIKQRTQTTNHFGFKDPSISKILPFWQSIFDKLTIKDHYIIALRNPLSCAKSYHDLTGTDLELGLLLWLMHFIPAVQDAMDRRTIFVSYDLMMQNPVAQVLRIKNLLQILTPDNPLAMQIFAETFLNKNLYHNRDDEESLKNHPATAVVPLCMKTYNLLLQLAKDEISFQHEKFIIEWQHIQDELRTLYPLYCYLDSVLRRHKILNRQLIRMKKSIIWKLLYPLYWIDDKFRGKRIAKRAEKKLVTAYE
jgi:hypothetical protein